LNPSRLPIPPLRLTAAWDCSGLAGDGPYTAGHMPKRNEKEEVQGGLSPRVVLQLCGGVILVIAIVALAGGFFDADPVARPPQIASVTPSVPLPPPVEFTPNAADVDRSAAVELDPPAYEFGFLRPEEVRTKTIRLTNRDEVPIRLQGTWRGCSCTTLDIRPVTLQPGESIAVPATLTAGMTPTSKDSSVKLELIGRPPITLPTKGEIIRGVRARPRDISTYSSRGTAGNYTRVGRTTIDAPEGPAFRVLSVNGAPQDTSPSLQHVIAWDVSDYDAETGLNAAGAIIPKFWLVETDHPETPVIELQVRHRSLSSIPRGERPWFYVEQRVNVGGIPAGGFGEFTLPVKWIGGTKSAIGLESAHSTSDLFEAALVRLQDKDKDTLATIRITPAPETRGPFQGDIVLGGNGYESTLPVIGHAAR
jgi:hypothetical protein